MSVESEGLESGKLDERKGRWKNGKDVFPLPFLVSDVCCHSRFVLNDQKLSAVMTLPARTSS